MFMFMFVSGWLVKSLGRELNLKWLLKRFRNLMIPYLAWTLINIFRRGNTGNFLSEYVYRVLSNSYWFLIVLFFCDCTIFIINNIKINKYFSAILFIILSNAIYVIFPQLREHAGVAYLRLYAVHMPFYMAGFFMADKKHLVNRLFDSKIVYVLYPLAILFYSFKGEYYSVFDLKMILANLGLSSRLIYIIVTTYNHYIVATLGCWFIATLVKFIYKHGYFDIVQKFLIYIGQYTLLIYILDGTFRVRCFDSLPLNFLISFMLSITLPVFVYKILDKFSPTRFLLLGKSYR